MPYHRVLVTGGTGMLGRMVALALRTNPSLEVFTHSSHVSTSDHHVVANLVDQRATDTLLNNVKPDIIVHCAAIVNVNACETDKPYARALHVDATKQLADSVAAGRFIYISTDSVFDGQRGNYTEADKTNPLNYYAETKLMGEEQTLSTGGHALVLRSNIVGYHQPMKHSLFEWAYSALSNGEKINGYDNIHFNPLYCGWLAKVVTSVVLSDLAKGIYHVGSLGGLSKYEFLRRTALALGFDAAGVRPVTFDPASEPAMRPLNTVLNTDKITKAGFQMPSVESNLQSLFDDFSKTLSKA